MSTDDSGNGAGRRSVRMREGSPADISVMRSIDDDASRLFENAGLFLDLPPGHAYSVVENERWLSCLSEGNVLIAVNEAGKDIGFVAVATCDGEPYVEQLSVRTGFMRQGVGTELLKGAERIALRMGGSSLWLTTYRHLHWNRPFYERHGFVLAAAEQCGVELAQEHRRQRRWLPMPHERVVMRKELNGTFL